MFLLPQLLQAADEPDARQAIQQLASDKTVENALTAADRPLLFSFFLNHADEDFTIRIYEIEMYGIEATTAISHIEINDFTGPVDAAVPDFSLQISKNAPYYFATQAELGNSGHYRSDTEAVNGSTVLWQPNRISSL